MVISALGTVTPLATVTVVSQISGDLQKVGFTEGQQVKKGDFLAQIDPRPYQALKAQYEGQLAHDQGLLEQARSTTRATRACSSRIPSPARPREPEFVVKQYEGTVRADQALVDAQALNIAYATSCRRSTAASACVWSTPAITSRPAPSTGIAVITQMQPISVIFSVPEDALAKILPKMRDGAKLSAVAYDRSNVKMLASGVVSVLDNQVDTTTGMVKLRANFDNTDEALFPNQFVNMRLLVDTLTNDRRRADRRHPARRAGRLRLCRRSTARPACAC